MFPKTLLSHHRRAGYGVDLVAQFPELLSILFHFLFGCLISSPLCFCVDMDGLDRFVELDFVGSKSVDFQTAAAALVPALAATLPPPGVTATAVTASIAFDAEDDLPDNMFA